MARGNRRTPVYHCDGDRYAWLELLARACERFNFVVYAYCQMTDHYHMMVETPDGNLSQGLHHLNATYAQYINRRHRFVGHLFQGRYKAILVQKDGYLLELSRYIVLNPVRAGMTESAADWFWSSYGATIGERVPAPWLHTAWLLAQFSANRPASITAYKAFICEGIGQPVTFDTSFKSLVVGDKNFEELYLGNAAAPNPFNFSREQRRPLAKPLEEYAQAFAPTEAMAQAYRSTAFTMKEIARHFGVAETTVRRAVQRCKISDT